MWKPKNYLMVIETERLGVNCGARIPGAHQAVQKEQGRQNTKQPGEKVLFGTTPVAATWIGADHSKKTRSRYHPPDSQHNPHSKTKAIHDQDSPWLRGSKRPGTKHHSKQQNRTEEIIGDDQQRLNRKRCLDGINNVY
jgi:hypothetical protein